MTLIEQFNSFCRASKGQLTLAERGLYMTLLDIWNRIPGRPEWFDVSIPQIMHEAKVGSRTTVVKTRDSLEKKGFIETHYQGRGKILRVKLVKFESSTENGLPPVQKMDYPKSEPVQKMDYHQYKNCTTTSTENGLGVVQKMDTSQSTEITEYTESLSKAGNTFEIHNPPEREIPTCPDDVWQKYNTYRPQASPQEKETLAVWSEEYGTRAVKDAIDKGIQSGGKSMNYIGQILRNGGTNGQRYTAYGRPYRPKDPEAERNKWHEEARKFGYDVQ